MDRIRSCIAKKLIEALKEMDKFGASQSQGLKLALNFRFRGDILREDFQPNGFIIRRFMFKFDIFRETELDLKWSGNK